VAARSVRLRDLAVRDIDDAVDFYVVEAGAAVAQRFVDAVERAVGRVGRSPHSGSLRLAHVVEIPSLRVRPLHGFPHLVFYVVGDEHVDVWRILHSRRDIATAIGDETGA
jgi:toxin ParE1/3/4